MEILVQRHLAKPANMGELAQTVAELVEEAGLRGI